MASFGKKILSAFVELTPDEAVSSNTTAHTDQVDTPGTPVLPGLTPDTSEKFRQYFDRLFSDANLPGPDYYEFSKMTDAMQSIADEKARFAAAFAGLNTQGLNKSQLLETAACYLRILEKDASSFNQSVDDALQEKVAAKKEEVARHVQRIEALTREISDLQNKIQLLQMEVKESEEKIASNTGGYRLAAQQMSGRIESDIEKIKAYINT